MWGGIILKEFIDKTSEQNGTAINREAMMAIQGFQAKTTNISNFGRVTEETNGEGHTLKTEITSTQIIETFTGQKTITKTTTFNSFGDIISEVIS